VHDPNFRIAGPSASGYDADFRSKRPAGRSMSWRRLKGFNLTLRRGGHTGRQENDATVRSTDAHRAPAGITATGTIAAAEINPNAGPGVPTIEGDDSTVYFDTAHERAARAEPGERIPDPIKENLSATEQAQYRDELDDVIKAQRYGRSLGSVSRR
jgi:hypothetical protein